VVDASIGQDIKEGLLWLWGHKVLRTLVLMAGTINLVMFAVTSVFVLFAQDLLGVADLGYGLLLSVLGVGGLVGALFAPRIVDRIGPGNTLRMVVVASGLLFLVFGTLSNVWAAAALLVLFGLFVTGWNVVSVTLRQTLTPDDLRARVAGAARLLAWGTQPLGALLGGVIASTLGLRAPYFIGAAVYAVMLVVTWATISNETLVAARNQGGGDG
jgi:predicted MFS family arabinose efflux permease